MQHVFNDGGRAAAGFKGLTGDCVCRSIAIATGRPYKEVYDAINVLGKNERVTSRKPKRSAAREGVFRQTYERYLKSIGWKWVPTMFIGKGCQVHMRTHELPSGNLILRLSGHCTAVIDGICHDTYDPSREGTRCVYGYFIQA